MSYMYILECNNGKYYTGSTKDLEKRMIQHWACDGANFTRKYKPVRLVYVEIFNRIDDAFYREKQVQNWSHDKKKALIESNWELLHYLAECCNESKADERFHHKNCRSESGEGFEVPLDSARGSSCKTSGNGTGSKSKGTGIPLSRIDIKNLNVRVQKYMVR